MPPVGSTLVKDAPIGIFDSGVGGLTVARAISAQLPRESLLYIGDTRINEGELELPHPRMHLRRFVLQPLAEIRPELILPRQAITVRELLAQLNDTCNVVCVRNDWES